MDLVSTPRVVFLRDLLADFPRDRGRVIVAVDGIGGAGMTVFARELAAVVRESGRAVFQASIDDFHRPSAERYRRGRHSPEGFYRDSYDERTFRRVLIDPFRLGGSAGFQTAAFDLERDAPIESRWETGPADAVLIVDGIFLNRPEFRAIWDFSIFLEVSWETAFARLAEQDVSAPGPSAASNERYRLGQELYFAEAEPRLAADVIVDNTNPERPARVMPTALR